MGRGTDHNYNNRRKLDGGGGRKQLVDLNKDVAWWGGRTNEVLDEKSEVNRLGNGQPSNMPFYALGVGVTICNSTCQPNLQPA